MLQLPIIERMAFVAVIVLSLISSVLAILRLTSEKKIYNCLMTLFIGVETIIVSVVFANRAIAIGGVPLTSIFESMLFISILFGISILVLSFTFGQIWFSSVMAWFIAVLLLLSAFVATPHSTLQPAARTIWVVLHSASMALAGGAIAVAGAIAALFLMTRRGLKKKNIDVMLGRMPNIEKLQKLNLLTVQFAFGFLTIGLICGIVLSVIKADQLEITAMQWLTDSKTILMLSSWVLLGLLLGLRYVFFVRARLISIMTLLVCVMIIFGIVGTAIFCDSEHDFTEYSNQQVQQEVP